MKYEILGGDNFTGNLEFHQEDKKSPNKKLIAR